MLSEQDPFGTEIKDRPIGSANPVKLRKNPKDKKMEQITKEANEYSRKNGVCSFHLPLGPLFVGQRMCVSRLDTPVKSILDGFAALSIDKNLLTDDLKKELNPMSIKLKSVKNMPAQPVSYETLRKICHPCNLSYQFYDHDIHKTKGRPQTKNIYWDDLNVVLLGTIPRALLLEYLLGPPMEIRIHDREQISDLTQPTPALFGDDGEDEKINNVGYISGRRTQYNALKERPSTWHPYGVAKVNMSDFLLGNTIINLQLPVHSCSVPDVLGRQADKGKILGIPGSVDGPSDPPMPPGNYMDSHTMIKVRLEIASPLVSPEEVASKPTLIKSEECPYGRIVYIFDHKHRGAVKAVLDLVTEINARGLGLSNLSPAVLDAALSTYKLSVEQQTRKDLDIITGFQLMDGKHYMLVLEGLAHLAINKLWYSGSKPQDGVKVLYNSDVTFSDRLYGALDVDLTRVKLHEPLTRIVQQPLLFVRDMLPRDCFSALTKLDDLMQCQDLRTSIRNDLFPTADQIISMSREFGVPLTADDMITDTEKEVADKVLSYGTKAKSAIPANTTARTSKSRMHLKDPLDMSNVRYLEVLKSRQMTAGAMDYVNDNIRTILLESRQNKLRKHYKPTQQSGQRIAHNYSTQTYNSTEIAKDIIRNNLDPNTLYTYNPAYHHSATFVPVNLKDIEKNEKINHRKKFVSKKDWSYPGVKSLIQCNSHSRRPDEARIDSLHEEWQENTNHSNKLVPTVEGREAYPWIDRKLDMDVWSYPASHFQPAPEPPISIMLPGVKLKEEKDETKSTEDEKWQKRLIVDDPAMYFHRCNPQTEAIQFGLKSSNDLSRLENILRDPPKKFSFAKMKSDIPPLRVVHYPGVDFKARSTGIDVDKLNSAVMLQEKARAFHPGPYEERSWSVETNKVPAIDYNNNQDGYFNVYHNTQHTRKEYKRQIEPLGEDEYKSTYLFADPNAADASFQRLGELKLAQSSWSDSNTNINQTLDSAVM